MKTKIQSLITLHITSIALASAGYQMQAQGTFGNLDFESANVPDIPFGQFGSLVPVSQGLPGWTAYAGTNQFANVLHNNLTLSTASVSILGPEWSSLSVFEGRYGVALQAGDNPFGAVGDQVAAAIAQTGLIPNDSQSIRFFARGGLSVSFAGQQIPLTVLGGSAFPYYIYGGDISAYAGQIGELRFTGSAYLDFIQFSAQSVPEPSVFGLFALGSLLLGWRHLRRTR